MLEPSCVGAPESAGRHQARLVVMVPEAVSIECRRRRMWKGIHYLSVSGCRHFRRPLHLGSSHEILEALEAPEWEERT